MKIRSVIVDDEKHCRENLTNLLQKYFPEIEIVGYAKNALEGLQVIKLHQPNVVFLDVEMPGGDAFNMLDLIDNPSFEIVFVTAFDHYALKAIKFSALDYLLKPIHTDDLKKAIYKTKKILALKMNNMRLMTLKHNRGNRSHQKIALPTDGGIEYFDITDVIYIKGEGNYSWFYHKDSERKVLVSKTLSEYEEILDDFDFIRSHKGFLVNLHQVKKFLNKDGGCLQMCNNHEIPIARRRRETVKEKLAGIAKKT